MQPKGAQVTVDSGFQRRCTNSWGFGQRRQAVGRRNKPSLETKGRGTVFPFIRLLRCCTLALESGQELLA